MIIIFEQDMRRRPGMGFWKSFFSSLRPMFESSIFHGRKSYRVGWINWSISIYQSESLRGFMEHIASGAVGWRAESLHLFLRSIRDQIEAKL